MEKKERERMLAQGHHDQRCRTPEAGEIRLSCTACDSRSYTTSPPNHPEFHPHRLNLTHFFRIYTPL
ncbi:MAG TPA: hypothetical protein ENI62_04625 [Gammaproteobacteria bacterium]|nr:hypothetical protein [Gammaproteobacteria bacterium]